MENTDLMGMTCYIILFKVSFEFHYEIEIFLLQNLIFQFSGLNPGGSVIRWENNLFGKSW